MRDPATSWLLAQKLRSSDRAPKNTLSLLPLLWSTGVGADVTARTAAPVVGGLLSATLLTLLVLPAAYALWRRAQLRRSVT